MFIVGFYGLNRDARKVPSNIHVRAQRRLRSDCASAQSDQSLRCPHVETLHPWLSKMHPVKILIRLRNAKADVKLRWAHVSEDKFSDVVVCSIKSFIIGTMANIVNTRVLKKVLSLGSDYFSATFYQTNFNYKPSKYSPLLKHIFVTFLPNREKQINSLLLISVGDTDK